MSSSERFTCDQATWLRQGIQVVRDRWAGIPAVGIVLGSGLGEFSEAIEIEAVFEKGQIPHYPQAGALGHRGRFLCGCLNGVTVVAMDGRAHLYEGYTPQEAVFPVRLMLALGAGTLVISNAAGTVNPEFAVGDVAILKDQINLMWANPLRGRNDDRVGPRFPDMSTPFDSQLAEAGKQAAPEGARVHSGVYLGMSGPNYESRAEYRMARLLGADLVGMSTVPEVLTARHAGARVFAASVVSNAAWPGAGSVAGHEVVDNVRLAEPVLRRIVCGVLEQVRTEREPCVPVRTDLH
ncbi:MAG: purine-nucleoside phosphorylase [Planctomycetaceae bacterium]